MTDEITSWLSQKFGQELQDRLPLPVLGSALLALLLAWSARTGAYLSAGLSLMYQTPAAALAAEDGVSSLPFFVLLAALLGPSAAYAALRLLARRYFLFVASQPRYTETLDRMVHENLGVAKTPTLSELRDAEDELETRRSNVRVKVRAYEWLSLAGLTLLVIAAIGNVLDLVWGIALLTIGLLLLHSAVGTFLEKVTPWYARVEALVRLAEREARDRAGAP